MDKDKIKSLFENFVKNFDQKKSQETWARQSKQFRSFWKDRIMTGKGELTEQEMSTIICILDSRAKGIRGSGIEPVCMPMGITQKRWYRLFREIKSDDLLKKMLDSLFNSSSKDEQVKIINKIYETYHNSLTTKSAIIINDMLFAYAPDDNISAVSLNHRYMIINAFELGNSEKLDSLPYGEKIAETKDLILSLKSTLGIKLNS